MMKKKRSLKRKTTNRNRKNPDDLQRRNLKAEILVAYVESLSFTSRSGEELDLFAKELNETLGENENFNFKLARVIRDRLKLLYKKPLPQQVATFDETAADIIEAFLKHNPQLNPLEIISASKKIIESLREPISKSVIRARKTLIPQSKIIYKPTAKPEIDSESLSIDKLVKMDARQLLDMPLPPAYLDEIVQKKYSIKLQKRVMQLFHMDHKKAAIFRIRPGKTPAGKMVKIIQNEFKRPFTIADIVFINMVIQRQKKRGGRTRAKKKK